MHDIAEFLGAREPFSGLDPAALERLAKRTEVEFFPAGTRILPQGEQPQGRVRVIRRGAVELLDRGRLADLLGEGEMFGHPSVLSGLPTRYEVRAREDTLTYSIAPDDVLPLLGRPSSIRFLARSLLSISRNENWTPEQASQAFNCSSDTSRLAVSIGSAERGSEAGVVAR